MGPLEEAMERAAQGKHTVWLGSPLLRTKPGWDVLIIHCDGPTTTFGPLGQARAEIEARIGALPEYAQQTSRALDRLRRRLLEQLPAATQRERLLQALERWRHATGGRALLVFDALEAADDATLETLHELADASPVPWWLAWREAPAPETPGASLFDALGPALSERQAEEDAHDFDWSLLPPDILHMMRLASVIGAVFEASLVAEMLTTDIDEVLYGIQVAYDLGARIEDRGEGRFALTADDVTTLRSGLLPSLYARWSARLAGMLIEEAPAAPRPMTPTWRPEDAQAAFGRASEGPSAAYAGMFEAEDEIPEPSPTPVEVEASTPASFEARPMPERDEGDHARAAQYLEEAGQLEDAVSRLLVAARQVSAHGDARRGWLMCRRALGLTQQMAPGARQRALRVRGLMELGRIQWRGAAMGPPFTLAEALVTLEEASRGLPPGAEPALRGELATWIAGVCYDLGDLASLRRGAQELARASRVLLEHGAPVEAARLLNDQAAVLVRLGDPVQAVYLLHQSRRAFESIRRQDPEDPIAAFELGETQHLLATMPMHARVKPGQESEAIERGLAHAETALELFEEVGQTREQARVLETMGRLELQRGGADAAETHLRRGLSLQQKLGDVTGLARTTDALATVYLVRGDAAHALAVLAESIALHREKGSPAGLDFNHATLDAITEALEAQPGDEALAHALAAIHAHLAQAEGRHPQGEA